ncbi:MAG: TolC family protein [Bacteroidota bacterium]|nr:TolC family protein [Candidatus Kapabacteria bacterium]MDW8220469.1 TolC family protein [Bacteroidota bacterium]
MENYDTNNQRCYGYKSSGGTVRSVCSHTNVRRLKGTVLIFVYILAVCTIVQSVAAQASSKMQPLSLQECEQQFLKANLLLLAEQFAIEAAEARALQAALWDNPILSAELNAWNPEGKRVLDIGNEGQKVFAIQQLIYLGGKKEQEIVLARANSSLARLQFQDLLRTLRYQLRTGYFILYYDRFALQTLTQHLRQLDTLIAAYGEQAKKGNLPYKDLVRLQALYLTLQNSRTIFNTTVIEEQKRLQTLLATTVDIIPIPRAEELQTYQRALAISVDSLQILALRNRPDLAAMQTNIRSAEVNLALQEALAVPDIMLGATYDQRGGAFVHQVNLTLSITLPLWNRNQGNIALAHAELARVRALSTAQAIEVRNQVEWAYRKYQESFHNAQIIGSVMEQDFAAVYEGMLYNFQRRNVSLLEFTDFIESYTNSIIQMTEIRKKLAEACEELNLVTATPIFY